MHLRPMTAFLLFAATRRKIKLADPNSYARHKALGEEEAVR